MITPENVARLKAALASLNEARDLVRDRDRALQTLAEDVGRATLAAAGVSFGDQFQAPGYSHHAGRGRVVVQDRILFDPYWSNGDPRIYVGYQELRQDGQLSQASGSRGRMEIGQLIRLVQEAKKAAAGG